MDRLISDNHYYYEYGGVGLLVWFDDEAGWVYCDEASATVRSWPREDWPQAHRRLSPAQRFCPVTYQPVLAQSKWIAST